MNITAHIDRRELMKPFVISRGAIDHVELVVVEITDDGIVGRGEGAPLAFMGQSPGSDLDLIESVRARLGQRLDRDSLRQALPSGSARNAIDCALWDLAAKRERRSIWELAGVPAPSSPITGVITVSLGSPDAMASSAAALADHALIKVKLDDAIVEERMRAVRKAAPRARLTVDINQAWTFEQLLEFAPLMKSLGVELIEQPLPRDGDERLSGYQCPLPLAADESCRTTEDLGRLQGRYQIVNVKLDKTGGLTEALGLAREALRRGFRLMTGCNVATSLSMAPAYLVASMSEYCDLDGPTMLKRDREHGLRFDRGLIYPCGRALWG